MAETGFSHRLTAYKIVRHFFGLSYCNISGSNQVKNRFFRISNISVPSPHAQLRVMDILRTLGSGLLSVTAMLDFSGKANTSIHGLGGDDTARDNAPKRPLPLTTLEYFCINHRNKRVFQFKIIINVLVSSFRFILLPMLWVYGYYKYFNSFSAGIDFRRQNLKVQT